MNDVIVSRFLFDASGRHSRVVSALELLPVGPNSTHPSCFVLNELHVPVFVHFVT